MRKQLKRWSHGFVQNIQLHWKGILRVGYLRSMIAVSLWDAVIASTVYLFLLPLLAITFANPYFLIGYVIDIPALLVPTLLTALRRKEVLRLLASVPAFFVLRTVNSVFLLEALWSESSSENRFESTKRVTDMTAGLPGTGIGCLFYLISALCMPFIEVYMTCRGRSSRQRWKLVATQFGFALGIAGGFWVTGWCLSRILPATHVLSQGVWRIIERHCDDIVFDFRWRAGHCPHRDRDREPDCARARQAARGPGSIVILVMTRMVLPLSGQAYRWQPILIDSSVLARRQFHVSPSQRNAAILSITQ
ncbi:MAG: hypothetical protein IPG64_16070 [Haliea sp.]|nr:hypothetical protein [Haliea sp.]